MLDDITNWTFQGFVLDVFTTIHPAGFWEDGNIAYIYPNIVLIGNVTFEE